MTNSMNNLTTLIKRLEAATSRLEDMVPNLGDAVNTNDGSAPSEASSLPPSDEADQSQRQPPPLQPAKDVLPPAITDFQNLINREVQRFVELSGSVADLIAKQSIAVLQAFDAERKFLMVTTRAKKPDIQSPGYMEILKELQSTMGAVNDIREANRSSPFFNHLTAVSEGIAVLGWITIDPKPADYITTMLASAQYSGDRVIREYKEKDPSQVEWTQSFYKIFKALSNYVKQHYPKGVIWNKDGIDPQEAHREIQSAEASLPFPTTPLSSNSAPPPPPLPPPLPSFDTPLPPPSMPTNGIPNAASNGGASDMGAVFDQISKGEAITSHLRKVSPSSQTHKNPSLRANTPVPTRPESPNSLPSSAGKSIVPGKKPKPESMRTKKPPRKELDGSKWIIEHFDSPAERVVEIQASLSQSILITRCTKTSIRVFGKANAISLHNCIQCSLVIDSLVSSVDVIKSPGFELQILGTLPTILLDQVDGAAVYLSKESLGTEIFTSKCTGVNINLPGPTEEDDYEERPLPEQIKSIVKGGALISEIVEHAG